MKYFSHSQIDSSTRGFSLVEIMFYMAILVLVSSALVSIFLSLDTVLFRNKIDRELTRTASIALERVGRTIRNAESVNNSQSVLNATSGAIALVDGATTTRFYLQNGNLMVSVNGAVEGPLTSDAIRVGGFMVTRYVGVNTELVRVALTLSATSTVASSTRVFYTSGVLRGTYD